MANVRKFNRPVITSLVITVIFWFFACQSNSTGPEPEDKDPENITKTLTLEPGMNNTLEFAGNLTIDFPSDAVSSEKEITAEELNTETNADVYANTGVLSPVYILKPHGQTLQNPAQVEFDISEIEIPEGLSENDLEIYSYSGSAFEAQNARIEDGKLVCAISHFSMLFVRMKAGISLFGGSDILETELHVYKQNGYLCLDNIRGNLSKNPWKVLCHFIHTPVNNQVIYRVSLFESPSVGFDKLIFAKKTCRVVWDNAGKAYEPVWAPNQITVDGEILDSEISYDQNPANCYQWQPTSEVSANGSYGDEYIINYNENKQIIGSISPLQRETHTLTSEGVDFLGQVFHSDEMKQFIELSKLDENKKYNVKVEMYYSDWQVGSSNSRTSADFKLSEVPVEESPNQPPSVDILQPLNNASYTAADDITFNAQTTDPENRPFANNDIVWSSDKDGEIGRGNTIKHQGFSVGRHTVTCTATDEGGMSNYDQVAIVITAPADQKPAATILSPVDGSSFPSGQSITFQGTATDFEDGSLVGTSCQWTSSLDGNLSPGTGFSKSTLSVGTHTITLTAMDSRGNTGSASITIEILAVTPVNTPPVASFTVFPTSAPIEALFSFDASSSSDNEDPTSSLYVRWDWENDGAWDTDYSLTKAVMHQYSTVGSKTIKLQVIDNGGLTSTTTQQITVTGNSNTSPTASFTVTPFSGTTVTQFSFDASGCSDDEDPTSSLQVRWDWENDGTWDTDYSTTKTATHHYSTVGTKTVMLEVIDTGGLFDQTTQTITVESGSSENETGTTEFYGVTYKTVKIGNQEWLAENLKVTRYRDGSGIPNITDKGGWANLSTGAYCAYYNNETDADTYGYLYNWYAVSDPKNLAPTGWHVPTDEEWKTLEKALGMSQSAADNTSWRGSNEGSKLAGRADLWYDGTLENNAAFGQSGFSALPAGYRNGDGYFYYLGYDASFWSATEYDASNAWSRYLTYGNSDVYRYDYNKQGGFSIRLVRD